MLVALSFNALLSESMGIEQPEMSEGLNTAGENPGLIRGAP